MMFQKEIELKSLANKDPEINIDTLEANQFLLTIYRRTELNWNSSNFSPIETCYSFFASRFKLKYNDSKQLSATELRVKIHARDPKLPDRHLSTTDIPLWEYVQYLPNINHDQQTIEAFSNLTAIEQTQLKEFANAGHSRLQFLQAFLSLQKNDKNSARHYLEQSATKYPLARFHLLRNLFFGSKTWGIAVNKAEAIKGFDALRNQGNIYTVLCATLLFNALTAGYIHKNELSIELQAIIQPLIKNRLRVSSTSIQPYAAPTADTFPITSIINANKQQNSLETQTKIMKI